MKNKMCPLCKNSLSIEIENFNTHKKDKDTGNEIIIENIKTLKCLNNECDFSLIPADQERKIYKIISDRTRFDLQPSEISTIRESLPFQTKFEAADFLCLNEKAFTKWQLGYSEPNRAYDLLLRLAVYSHENFTFIKKLHEKNFKFDQQDYQLICKKNNLDWHHEFLNNSKFAWSSATTQAFVGIGNPGAVFTAMPAVSYGAIVSEIKPSPAGSYTVSPKWRSSDVKIKSNKDEQEMVEAA